MAPPRKRPRRLVGAAAATVVALLAAAPPAAAGALSPEGPASTGAEDAHTLYWIALIVGGLLVLAVHAALLTAVIRYRRRRGARPRRLRGGRRLQARAALALALLATGLYAAGVVLTEGARDQPPTTAEGLTNEEGDPAVVDIQVTGQQWLWRYNYPNGAFSYSRLVVPANTLVRLAVRSTDVVHRWYVPALGVHYDAVPGTTNRGWFRAEKTGTYEGRSTQFSGGAFAAMRTAVEVVEPERYEEYVANLDEQLSEAQERVSESPAGEEAS